MHIKTDQFAKVAEAALQDGYTRAVLDGMHEKIKERLQSMRTFPDPTAARELGAAIRAESVARLPELLEEFEELSSQENNPESSGFFSKMRHFFDTLSE